MANGSIHKEGNKLIVRGTISYFLEQKFWVRLMGAFPKVMFMGQYIDDAIGLAAWYLAKKTVPKMIGDQRPTSTEVKGLGEITVTFTLEDK